MDGSRSFRGHFGGGLGFLFLGEEVLALVVVTEGEASLVGEFEVGGNVGEVTEDFHFEAFEIDSAAFGEFAFVVSGGAQEGAEDGCRVCGCGGVELVFDGGVHVPEGFLLSLFEDGEETSEAVAGVVVVWVEHGGGFPFGLK